MMGSGCRGLIAAVLAAALMQSPADAASERPLFIALGNVARAPIGWVEFCAEYPQDCTVQPLQPRDLVRNDPYPARAMQSLVSNVVGTSPLPRRGSRRLSRRDTVDYLR